ncbi:hypothetical protein L914_19827 [Phytophthora nicotianae]|uniref:Ankyrin repeat-containing domain n=1 Tax=Phytophthora nicotianae TaxID=4792 RepID=W2MBH8_PHYNI|nr:hypothetical protein L914_19827 [Phytophthora nicotianae]
MVVRAAAASGRSGMLQLLEGTKTRAAIPWTKFILIVAANCGHWGVVHWLHERWDSTHGTRQANTELVLAAFEQNNVEELKWALGNGYGVWRSSYCSFYGGDWRYKTEMLRYMLDGGHAEERIARDALVEASEKGGLSFMQWLVSYMEAIHVDVGVDNISLSMENACDRGHLDIVQWLLAYQDNFPSDDDVVVCMEMAMINAARGGALEVVRWLYETYATDSSIDLLAGVSQILMPVYVLDQRWMLQQVTVVFTCSNIFMKPMLRRDESRQLTKHSSSIIKSLYGRLEAVKWLRLNRSEECTTTGIDKVEKYCSASSGKRLGILKRMNANGPD